MVRQGGEECWVSREGTGVQEGEEFEVGELAGREDL